MSAAREIESIMARYGFWLKRKRKHAVWTNGKTLLVTSRTPSDARAVANIEARARRAARAA